MKKIEIVDLYSMEYSVKVINALRQNWSERKRFHCIGAPKRCNMLLYLQSARAVYTMKDGTTLTANEGSVISIPMGAEYSVHFFGTEKGACDTVHINFLLSTAEGDAFVLSDGIEVLRADGVNCEAFFHRIDRYSEANIPCHGKIKSIMYDLLFQLSAFYHKGHRDKFGIIANGIAYLEQDEEQLLSIEEIAKLCHVSEVYFRRLFKEYAGISPAKYRTEIKLRRAKSYLVQEELSIAEISDKLGFSEVSYFIKLFRTSTGQTPKEYRNKNLCF